MAKTKQGQFGDGRRTGSGRIVAREGGGPGAGMGWTGRDRAGQARQAGQGTETGDGNWDGDGGRHSDGDWGRGIGGDNLGGDWFSRRGPAGTRRSLFMGPARSSATGWMATRRGGEPQPAGAVVVFAVAVVETGTRGDVGRVVWLSRRAATVIAATRARSKTPR